MKVIALRDFQRQGTGALPPGDFDPFLLAGRDEEFLAVRVPQGVPAELLDRIHEVAALMAFRSTQEHARRSGVASAAVVKVSP